MGTLKQEAEDYEPQQIPTIDQLGKVSVDIEIEEKEYERADKTTYKNKVVTVDGEDYRVPVSVLKALKEIVAVRPDVKEIQVKKSGEGMKTNYTVVPL